MESYREKLKLQNVVFAIGCVALALFSVLGFLGEAGVVKLAPSVGDGHWQSRWRGFISGASFGILAMLGLVVWYLCTIDSDGVAYMAPFVDSERPSIFRTLLRRPQPDEKFRPPEYGSRNRRRQR